MTLSELLEEMGFVEELDATREEVGAATESVDILTEGVEADVNTAEDETRDVAVAFTVLDAVLFVEVVAEAEVETAVPKQATPPSG